MTFANHDTLGKKIAGRLNKAGSAGVSYLKCLLDVLTGRTNVFF